MRVIHVLFALVITCVLYYATVTKAAIPQSLSYTFLATPPAMRRSANARLLLEDRTTGTRPEMMTSVLRNNGYVHNRDGRTASLIVFRYIVDYIDWYPLLKRHASPSHVYALRGIDLMANKGNMYRVLRREMEPSLLESCVPDTYLLYDRVDRNRFLSTIREGESMFIMKKNLQRQQGCVIVRNEREARERLSNDAKFVVAQRLLLDNLLVMDRKCNIRRYVIIVRTERYVRAYLHDDGFVYYSAHAQTDAPTERSFHITTGYIDRKIYDTHPMTLTDMYAFVGKANADAFQRNMSKLLERVFGVFVSELSVSDPVVKGRTCFAIMGCDLSVNKNYDCMLMEINKGPDLNAKDDRDGSIKRKVVDAALVAARLINGELYDVRLIGETTE